MGVYDLIQVIVGFTLGIFCLYFLYKHSLHSKCTFYCNVYDWHLQPRDISGDGILNTGHCPRCGKRLHQNSKGKWIG